MNVKFLCCSLITKQYMVSSFHDDVFGVLLIVCLSAFLTSSFSRIIYSFMVMCLRFPFSYFCPKCCYSVPNTRTK